MPVVREKVDPKTWLLYNTDRDAKPTYGGQQAAMPLPEDVAVEDAAEKAANDRETFRSQWANTKVQDRMEAEMRREYIKQELEKLRGTRKFRQLQRNRGKVLKRGVLGWKHKAGEFDSNAWIQNMYDLGIIDYDEDGVYVGPDLSLPEDDMGVLGNAADIWADKVGFWGEGGFDPTRYRPYGR